MSEPEIPSAPPRLPGKRRLLRRAMWSAAVLACVLIATVLGLFFWASSAGFENMVRKRLIAALEESTGGRVEIGAFHWHLLDLEAEADDLIIHGLEAPPEPPYAQVARLRARISVLGFLSPRVLLRDLEITRPGIHIIVYPDGSTNQPSPRTVKKSSKSAIETFFDLQASHVAVEQGVLLYQQQSVPLDFEARDVGVRLGYVAAGNSQPERYRIEASATDLSLVRGKLQPLKGRLEAAVDLQRNAAYLRSFRITANGRMLDVNGDLLDFSRPRWDVKAKGDLEMALLEPLTGFPFSKEGVAHIDFSGAGQAQEFRADGSVHLDGGSYVAPGINARGLRVDARVHADPRQLLVTSLFAHLRDGGEVDGEILLDHWLPPIAGAPVVQRAGINAVRAPDGKAPPPAPSGAITIPVNGRVKAEMKSIALDSVLDIVAKPPFQRFGLDGRFNGPVTANWVDGDVRTLTVGGTLSVSPSGKTPAGEAPAQGVIDATYTQRDGAVNLRTLDLRLPASQLKAQGKLGAFPLTSPSGMTIDFQSSNLGEFDTILRSIGLKRDGKAGVAALPVALTGQANFHGSWTGSLLDPHIGGELKATQLAIEIPANPNDKTGQPQWLHWDTVDIAGNYSADRVGIDHGSLVHGNTQIALDGFLEAAVTGRTRPQFDTNSLLRMHVRASKLALGDLLPLTGQSLPITGTLEAQFQTDGPIHSLGGSGWVELNGGTIYGEPVTHLRAQASVDHEVATFSSVALEEPAGKIEAIGSFNIKNRSFHFDARSAGVDIAKIERLRGQGPPLTGSLEFTMTGSGTVEDPRLEAHASLSGLTVSGEPVGSLDLAAQTAAGAVTYDLTTHFEAAQLTAHGQTALKGDFATRATIDFSRFNVAEVFKLAHMESLSGESALAGSVTIEGPLSRPEEMHGDARLQELAVTVSGVHLHSEGGVHASLANSRITLDPLHVTGEQTDLRAQGSLSLKDKRQLDIAASGSVNLKLAQTLDPDLTASGTTTFQVEAHGPLSSPGLRGRVDFENGALALEGVPNGLSQLHGTLEFNQDRLEVKSLTAMSGGGLLSVNGYLAYQHGIYADLSVTGKGIRIRYPQGVSSLSDATLRLQGTQKGLVLSGDVLITRFTVSPDLDMAGLAAQANAVQPVTPPDSPANHFRLDVHVVSSPQLNFQNAYAKLAGDVDLRVRGTLASPSLLGRVSITEGSATLAGTKYELQRGDIFFTNPVRIQPTIDLNATARVEDYDVTLGLHGTLDKLTVTYRSEPPLPEADVVALLALGRTQDEQRIYTQQQEQTGANPTTDALLGGALNATVSSRVQKLFGAGSVKVDPSYLGSLGNSTARITVEEQVGKNVTLTYATNVNTTAQQLIQAEISINRHVSLLVARDESGVFSMVVKATRRYR